ncbi:MAG TPA: hypothetical protein VLK84_24840 [Longimicrobium sp.]|nr:hypothetical protein [Longimicrobium sp.]
MAVPSAQAHRMRIMAEAVRWSAALPPGTRLPSCPWADTHIPGLHQILWDAPRGAQISPLVQRHLGECPECRRVVELRDEARANPAAHAAKLPDDVGPVTDWKEGILYGLMMALGMAVLIVFREPLGVGGAAWSAMIMGFLALGLTERFAGRRLPRHPYATGLLSAVAGVLVGMLLWNPGTADGDFPGPPVLAGCALLALLVGLLIGWMRDGYEPDDAGADDGPETYGAAEGQHAEADDAPPAPAVLLAAPDPLAELDEVRERPRPEHVGVPGREGA